jgi:NAD(P)-dependent dehydrogenase (short-subunit alcohol dehydrogenase family)/aryl carrier-like protein
VTLGLLGEVQRWLADDRHTDEHLIVITRGAVTTENDTAPPNLTHAPAWGLIRTAQTEHPGRIHILDADIPAVPADVLRTIATADEPQLALRDGVLYRPRLTRTTPVSTGSSPFGPDGTVLITGGTGTLGSLIARHLATHHGVTRLHLISRQGPNAPDADQLHAELTQLGAHPTITACDITDPHQLTTLLTTIPAEHPLTAIIHTAGTLHDAPLHSQTPAHLTTTFAPKATAAHHLHNLTRDLNLQAFILFSSAAGTLGSPGQANYAAANTYLDALAHHRHTLGLPATSLAWGLWEDAGMSGKLTQADLKRLARSGVRPLNVEQGLALFDAALSHPAPVLAPVALDAAALRDAASRAETDASAISPVLRALYGGPPKARHCGADPVQAREPWSNRLTGRSEDEQFDLVLGLVRAQIAQVLVLDSPSAVAPGGSLLDMGLDSLTAVDLRNRLRALTGNELPTTVVFDHPTPERLAAYLRVELVNGAAPNGGPQQDVLADLDRLETMLAAAHDEEVLRRAALRLQDLLGSLAVRTGGETVSDAAPFSAATDEELFGFLDQTS